MLEEADIDEIMAYISEQIMAKVYIVHDNFQLIGHGVSSNSQSDTRRLVNGMIMFETMDNDEIFRKMIENGENPIKNTCRFNHEDIQFRLFPIKKKATVIGFLCAQLGYEDTKYDEFLSHASHVLKMILIQKNLENNRIHSRKSDFVTHVLLGNITDEEELISLCNINGFDYSLNRLCIFIRKPRGGIKGDQHVLDIKVNSTIDRLCHANSLNIYKINYNNNIILFIMYSKEINIQVVNKDAFEFASQVTEALQEIMTVSCGIGKSYKGIGTVGKSFKQAIKAINLGSKLYESNNVHSYEKESVYHMLYNGLSYNQMDELYRETVFPLDEMDYENSGELTLTLKKYFECHFKSVDTAKCLHLHRNTLFYRLEKIKTILDYDFDNPMKNMKIHMGIYAKELLAIYEYI